ncbi:hypothetical protein [Variovorax sp. HW608]|uniref:hypothetical protein n=1 Tax=Variovorax sp. HW608 TaxID=1034889 RepID=UPI0012FDDC1F|nr:hypothetical protein [Variovorax sp. HW608]
MDRVQLRAVKRARRKAVRVQDCEALAACAISLLERSIACGHRRLAVLRLHDAAEKGAALTTQHVAYCEQVAKSADEPELKALVRRSRQLLKVRTASTGAR